MLLTSQSVGAKAKCLSCSESHVRIIFSYSNLHNMTNSIVEIPEVKVQWTGWQVALLSYAQHYVQVWGNGWTHYLLTQHGLNTKLLAQEY